MTITAEEVRAKLTTEFAKAAFDQLNVFGAKWTCLGEKDKNGQIYLSAAIEVGVGSFPESLSGALASNFDDAVINQFQDLQAQVSKFMASKGEASIIANPYDSDRTIFTYDKATNTFNKKPKP